MSRKTGRDMGHPGLPPARTAEGGCPHVSVGEVNVLEPIQ